jgi:hypothetical protein
MKSIRLSFISALLILYFNYQKLKNKATYSAKNGIKLRKTSVMVVFEITGLFWKLKHAMRA